jgi:nitrate/nitrite transporter NarK
LFYDWYVHSLPKHSAFELIKTTQFLERYVWVGSIYMFFFGGAYFVVLYYLPIYFQSIHSASPINSGVRMLALIIPLTLSAILQGFALSKIGIVPLFWIFGGAIATIGAGLFYTMDADTSSGKWIGYQILVGFATGATFQVAIANAQVHARSEDLSQVSAIVNCKSRPHCTQKASCV